MGNIEAAVGDLEAAVKDDLIDPETGTDILDDLTGIARQIAVEVIEEAEAQGEDVADAEMALSDGDMLRDDALLGFAEFKEAVNAYKDALAEAVDLL